MLQVDTTTGKSNPDLTTCPHTSAAHLVCAGGLQQTGSVMHPH